jgi:peptide/nickel transport system substrate-binding protein
MAVLVAAACGDDDNANNTSSPGNTTQPKADDTKALVIARDMDLNSLDPHLAYCDTCQIYLAATYDTLIGLDPKDNQTFIPRIAKKWSNTDDLKQFTFELDPAAKFSDGSPLEAKDVKFSFERLQHLKGSPAYFMDGVVSIDATDPHKVVIKLEAADSSFLAKVNSTYAGIINSTVAKANGATSAADADKTDKAEQWFLKNSAGSGPYKLLSYQPSSELRLTRNDNYWGPKPSIRDVIIKEVKDAVNQRQLLESGDADIAMQIDPDLASKMKTGGDVTVQKVPSFNFIYIAVSPGAEGAKVDLNDKIRQALRLAVDYKGLLDVTLGGSGRLQASPIPNGFLGTKDLPLPKQDVARAKQLLAEGGQPNGFEIDATFPGLNVYGVDFATMMQKIQSDFAKVGVKVNLQPVEFTVWRDKIRGPGIPLTAVYFAPDHSDTSQYLQYFGMIPGAPWSKRVSPSKPVINQTEVDLLAKAMAAPKLEDRANLYKQLGEEMIKEGYFIPLVNPDLILAYRSNLQGMHYSACCNLELGRLSRK